jgi:hypothetical protein
MQNLLYLSTMSGKMLSLLFILLDERLGPDLPRGRGKSIDGDLDVDDEGSKQNFKLLQSLHHSSIDYQSVRHEFTSLRRLIPSSAIENTSKNKVDVIWIMDEIKLTSWGLTNRSDDEIVSNRLI